MQLLKKHKPETELLLPAVAQLVSTLEWWMLSCLRQTIAVTTGGCYVVAEYR